MSDPARSDLLPDDSADRSTGVESSGVARESLFADPVIRALSGILALVVILFLATILSALLMGVVGSDAPRTVRERDLRAYEFATSSGSVDPEDWKRYIGALIDSGQLQKAQEIVDRGKQVIDDRPGQDMTFAQAQVYLAAGEYEKAAEAAGGGMKNLEAYHEAQKKVEGSPESRKQPINENYWGLLYTRAMAHIELKDWKSAAADLDQYLETKAGASDVYVRRAEVRIELGDRKGAESDYRRALKHLPDYEPALEGLKKLGAE